MKEPQYVIPPVLRGEIIKDENGSTERTVYRKLVFRPIEYKEMHQIVHFSIDSQGLSLFDFRGKCYEMRNMFRRDIHTFIFSHSFSDYCD